MIDIFIEVDSYEKAALFNPAVRWEWLKDRLLKEGW